MKESTEVKYLGITFFHTLKPERALKARLSAGVTGEKMLKKLLRSEFLDRKVKERMYTTLIKPIVTFGSPLWPHCNKATLAKLQAFERRIFRKITGQGFNRSTGKMCSNAHLHKLIKIPTIDENLMKLNKQFTERYTTHTNPFVRDWALTSDAYLTRKLQFTRDLKSNFF